MMRPVFALAMGLMMMFGAVGAQARQAPISAPATASASTEYRVGIDDKVRIIVFGEPTLSNTFAVNSAGALSLPLIGDVPAAGKTAAELVAAIQAAYANGYLRDPKVSIDMATFRPFYILGEVNKPGEYNYSNNLTVLNAVATAQGFTYRADKRRVYIKRVGENAEKRVDLTSTTDVQPGDTIRIGERYF